MGSVTAQVLRKFLWIFPQSMKILRKKYLLSFSFKERTKEYEEKYSKLLFPFSDIGKSWHLDEIFLVCLIFQSFLVM